MADNFAEFVLALGAECQRRLKERGVVMSGHCTTCTCNAVRVRRMSVYPDVYILSMKINGVERQIVYNGMNTFQMPAEDEWNVIIESILNPTLTMGPL